MTRKDIILLHRKEIRDIASKMKTKLDFLNLLNYVRKLECDDVFRPYSMKRLNYLCNANHEVEKRYTTFQIPKKSGQMREISAPIISLKSIHRTLNVIFECLYTPSSAAKGFANGLSIVDNAREHVGMNYVLNLDLKDFFPSIRQARVWARLQIAPFNFSKEIANVVAGLCCMQVKDENQQKYGVLPQGAPTSPILTNAICDKLDRRLTGLAKRFNLKYTRYADDITFSSMHSVYSEKSELWNELYRVIHSQNFTINDAKTRLQKKGSRQEVTGLTVCTKTNVTKKYVGSLKIILHVWEKFGRQNAYSRFLKEYLSNSISQKSRIPSMEEVLRGKLMYLKMVKGKNDSVYQSLNHQFNTLLSRDCSQLDINNIYTVKSHVFSCDFSDFEEIFHTKINFIKGKKGRLSASFQVCDHCMKVSLQSPKYSSLSESQIREDKNAVISLIRSMGKTFWSILKRQGN